MRAQAGQFGWNDDQSDEKQSLQNPSSGHPLIRKHSYRSFACESLGRALHRRANRSTKFLPRRSPLDEEFRRVVQRFALHFLRYAIEDFCHALVDPSASPCPISIWSPTAVPVSCKVFAGNSNTEAAFMLTRAMRQGFKSRSIWTTVFAELR